MDCVKETLDGIYSCAKVVIFGFNVLLFFVCVFILREVINL